MNIQNAILIAAITISVGNALVIADESQENRDQNLTPKEIAEIAYQERLRRRAEGLPSNPNETPTSPRHDKEGGPRGDLKRRPYKMEEAGIWFGTDESGKPCYQTIAKHFEKNPKFRQVGLVIYQSGWFSEAFETIGTVADENAREQLSDVISDYDGMLLWKHKKNGVWCPLQNVFIGGTGDIGKTYSDGKKTRNMCEVYARFLEAKTTGIKA